LIWDLRRTILPRPLTLKRRLTPEWVFSLSLATGLLLRLFDNLGRFLIGGCEDRSEESTLHVSAPVNSRHVFQLPTEAIQQSPARLRMSHLPTTEPHRYLHLVAFPEQPLRQLNLPLQVMLANMGPHPHLAQQQALLMLVRVSFLLRLLILPLAIVQKATNRWSTMGINFYQVEVAFLGNGQRLWNGQNTQVLTCVRYYANFFCSDPFVDPKLVLYNPYPRGKNSLSVDGVVKCSILFKGLQCWARRRRARPCSTLSPGDT